MYWPKPSLWKKCAGGLALIGTLLVLLPGCGRGTSDERAQTVIIALKPDKDPDRMLAETQALSAWLSERLGRPVEVVVPLSNAVIQQGFANGSIDLAYLSPTDAFRGREAGVLDVLLVGEIEGKPYYMSYWVSLADKPYESVEDLRDKPIAFSSRTSTSGFLIPLRDLQERGLLKPGEAPEVYFGRGNVFYGVGYVSAVERVLSGSAEAAAVSYYVLDGDRHMSSEQRARLKKVAEQGPVPSHVICVRGNLDTETREALREAILTMNTENPQLRDKVFTSKLIEVDADEHLRPVGEALSLARQLQL